MSFLIAVDDSLHNIKKALDNKGYRTVDLTVADFRDVDAYVVDKNNKDIANRKNTIADERVIAAGNDDVEMILGILDNHLAVYKNE